MALRLLRNFVTYRMDVSKVFLKSDSGFKLLRHFVAAHIKFYESKLFNNTLNTHILRSWIAFFLARVYKLYVGVIVNVST